MTRPPGKRKTKKARVWWLVCYPNGPIGPAWSSKSVARTYRRDLILAGNRAGPFLIVKVREVRKT